MILPDKYTNISQSFIGLSAVILDILKKNSLTIEQLWELFYKKSEKIIKTYNPTFNKFVSVINFMYLSGMINLNSEGEIYNENL